MKFILINFPLVLMIWFWSDLVFQNHRFLPQFSFLKKVLEVHDKFSERSPSYAQLIQFNMIGFIAGFFYWFLTKKSDLLPFSLFGAYVYAIVGLTSICIPLILNYKKFTESQDKD